MATTRRRSLRVSGQVEKTNDDTADLTVMFATRKRRTSLASKEDRKVLSEGDEEEVAQSKKIKKRSSVGRRVPRKSYIENITEESDTDEELFKNIKGSKRSENKPSIKEEEEVSEDSFDSSTKENVGNKSQKKTKQPVEEDDDQVEEKVTEKPESEFEAMRRKNIEERMKMFQELNLGGLKVEMEQNLSSEKKAVAARKSSLFSSSNQKSEYSSELFWSTHQERGQYRLLPENPICSNFKAIGT